MKNDKNKYIFITILIVIIVIMAFYLLLGKNNNMEMKNDTTLNNKVALNNEINSNNKDVPSNENTSNNEVALSASKKLVMYKSPNCGCCSGYAEEMEKQGFEVEVIKTDDMNKIKEKYNIPNDKRACHTTIAGNYFIEGHVPVEAVKKLLKEKPDIDGIGLPGMPSGTPGMPGPKRGPYEIYQSVNGTFLEYLKL